MEYCIFCGIGCKHSRQSQKNADMFYTCPNCGKYEIIFDDYNKNIDNKHIIAGYLYEFNKDKGQPLFIDFKQILSDGRIPKTPMQRIERLLINLYKISDEFGKPFFPGTKYKDDSKSPQTNLRIDCIGVGSFIENALNHSDRPVSIAYARNYNEVKSMFDSLCDLGYLKRNDKYGYVITPSGFGRAEQLASSNVESKRVFIAVEYVDEMFKTCDNAIKPACDACGFKGFLIKDKPHNNDITDEIIVEIKRSKFVIVDFTNNNNGVYFEAGYAQGLGRPVIRCCKEEWFKKTKGSKGLHFDVNHYSTILWKNHKHLLEELKKNIRANIDGAQLFDSD